MPLDDHIVKNKNSVSVINKASITKPVTDLVPTTYRFIIAFFLAILLVLFLRIFRKLLCRFDFFKSYTLCRPSRFSNTFCVSLPLSFTFFIPNWWNKRSAKNE